MKTWLAMAVMVPMIVSTPPRAGAQDTYHPQAEFCADASGKLCSLLAAYIGPDPKLKNAGLGYNGLFGALPKDKADDVQTPFDNMAWQMFVALNWASGDVKQPADKGLTAPGRRVWQTYPRVSAVFGDSPVQAGCTNALALPVFSIGSNGKGQPAPNNEEYLQAATNLPLIDVNGNWTVFERRVNSIEASYLRAPNGQRSQTLKTIVGQTNFIKANPGGVQFPASAAAPIGANGSIEIKASWRIIDRAAGDDPSRFYTQQALLAVAGDLVQGGRPFCRTVTLGLVGMHILQRNPVDSGNPTLLPQWIWATFEHVDNAPLAQAPCSVNDGCGAVDPKKWINQPSCGAAAAAPGARYSFFKQDVSVQGTNIGPQSPGGGTTQFPWNSAQPHAKGGTTAATAMPQATRCWSIFPTTEQLNEQWRMVLGATKSVFQNYMLIGTQWGADVESPAPPNPVPGQAVPGMLSNMTLETYIQNYTGTDKNLPGPGSCVACHAFATLPADNKTSANFSFLPFLAQPATARSKIKSAR